MDTRYDPAEVEAKWYQDWLDKNLFTPRPGQGAPFVIVMPPPNITGMLTMGHVLNMAVQDALIRWNMLGGVECLWLPGKDHAGIATQNAVEKQLALEGLTRHDLGRDEFVKRLWAWKDVMDRKITEQLKHLGCACDWSRERFTMDEGLTLAVRTAFVRLFEQGLIYRGEYVINSCPRCLTTLSDEEVEREDVDGSLYYLQYPFEDGGHVTVATTRPETMLGDVAVAVNPKDERYRSKWDKAIVLPIVGRRIPMIRDDFVDPEFGTGAVKVTPAHDADDFAMGERHGLTPVVVMDQKGTMNANAGPYEGLDRFEARRRVVDRLEQEGLLEKVTAYRYSLGKCYRCDTVVEPYLSTQYFVRMKPLSEPAMDAVRSGQIRFHPDKWTKVYFNWMEGIRDWCISRQLWWGHRIPVWHCTSCDRMVTGMQDPSRCPSCGGGLVREEDVLDTWFSSWLWPFSTLGWPERTPDLQRYYPTSVLVTGPDIIFFWVARMIMAGLHFVGEIPFRDVYLHGLIRDEFGRKMSKSLGNSPDPSDLIERYGADALRFTVISLTPRGSDILFADRQVETGRNFANKVWNAARLVRAATEGVRPEPPAADRLELCDSWILSRTAWAAGRVRSHFEGFALNLAAKTIYDFIWHEVCDWYLELSKERFYSDDEGRKRNACAVALDVMKRSLELLHPFMPSITEEVWNRLNLGDRGLLESGRSASEDLPRDQEAESIMETIIAIVEAVRNVRGEMSIHPSVEIPVYLAFPDGHRHADPVMDAKAYIMKMGKVASLRVGKAPGNVGPIATGIAGAVEVGIPLGDIIDVDVEKTRLHKEISRVEGLLARGAARLDNPEFLEKAPPGVVEKEKDKVGQLEQNLSKLRRSLSVLGG